MSSTINWHNLSKEEAYKITGGNSGGLSNDTAESLLKKIGKNAIAEQRAYSRLRLLIEQFNSSLIYILLGGTFVSFALGHYIDGAFMMVVLLINGLVGFIQEDKANKSLEALRKMSHTITSVIRDGQRREINATDLVPGDIIMVKAGDKIPADALVISVNRLQINEASLTGEGYPVEKRAGQLPAETPIFERHNMAFMGTVVESGRGTLLVVETGSRTEFGSIAASLRETKKRSTPLQQKIARMSRILGGIISAIIIFIVILGVLRGELLADILIAALALAASAIPEGLLPAITIILIMGMRRIVKEKGLVRKLAATETLGSVTVICTDKTGTLTQGTMQVSHILTATHELELNGETSIDEMAKQGGPTDSHMTTLRIAALVNEAYIENPQDELRSWIIRGTPTERALLLAAIQSGIDRNELWRGRWIEDMVHFESETKYAATLFGTDKGVFELFVIGAADRIIELAVSVDKNGTEQPIGEAERKRMMRHMEMTTSTGLRVVACARKTFATNPPYDALGELSDGLTLVGLIAIKDPLRPDAHHTINDAREAGIRTILITGDHRLTAMTIAREVGLPTGESCTIEGAEIEKMSEEELRIAAQRVCVYARVSPQHKLRIVRALQQNGEVVAMIGDGVNDAPALQHADVGIALGSGTDAAREASDIVLLDNNLKTVLKTIEEGRIIFNNIRKIFIYLTADSFSELFLFIAAISFALPIPLLPTQLLWINVVEDGLPNIALTTERERFGIMKEAPRSPQEPILNKPIKLWMVIAFFTFGLASLTTYIGFLSATQDVALARTAVFALSCIDSLLFTFSVRSFKTTIFHKGIAPNKYILGAVALGLALVLAAIYVPGIRVITRTVPMTLSNWGFVLLAGITEFSIIEYTKYLIFIHKKKVRKG
jgi:Ca2+-transporting ATPase